jgi:hypothetical protein
MGYLSDMGSQVEDRGVCILYQGVIHYLLQDQLLLRKFTLLDSSGELARHRGDLLNVKVSVVLNRGLY